MPSVAKPVIVVFRNGGQRGHALIPDERDIEFAVVIIDFIGSAVRRFSLSYKCSVLHSAAVDLVAMNQPTQTVIFIVYRLPSSCVKLFRQIASDNTQPVWVAL